MSIIRQRLTFEDRFTIMPNDWARDSRLTLRARGLLVQLLSHREGWEITIESLVRDNPEGRDAIRGAIKELEDAGYLVRHRQVDPKTRKFGKMDYLLVEPNVAFSGPGSPHAGEEPTKNTNPRTPSKEHEEAEPGLHVAPRSSDRPEGFHDHREAATTEATPEQGPREVLDAIQEVANTPRGNYSPAYDRFLDTLRTHYSTELADYAEHRNWTMGPKQRDAYGAQRKLTMLLNTARLENVELQE